MPHLACWAGVRHGGDSMNNYLLLAACFVLGIILRRSGRLPDNAAAALNGFVVHISLPALTLTYVHGLEFRASLILPALMPWVMFGIGCGFFWLASKAFGFSRGTTGALMLTGGLANTSFVGLPMIETFYGAEFLGLGILIDQLGTYLVLSTIGILVASLYSSGRSVNTKAVVRKIALFVPFQAVVLAFLLMPFEYPIWLDELLKRLGATLVPIALVSVGYPAPIQSSAGQGVRADCWTCVSLVVGPALILLLFAGPLRSNWQVLSVTVFEAAMGPMIGASIVAMDHELDPPLVTLMVGVGLPLSFLTLPLWWHLLSLL